MKKDFELKMFDQLDQPLKQKKTNAYFCKFHPYATENDFVEVVVKKSNKTVSRCRFCNEDKVKTKLENKKIWETEKKQLSDFYVKRTLISGHKIKMKDIPTVLVETKRAIIKIKRLTAKLNEPLAKCSTHGDLYQDQVIKKNKLVDGTYTYRCKKCMSDYHKKNWELNKAKIKLDHVKYKEANPDKVRQQKRNSQLKMLLKRLKDGSDASSRVMLHKYKKETIEKQKARAAYEKDKLTDYRVKRLLTKRGMLKMKDIPQELVECKRALILLKRAIKDKKQHEIHLLLEGKKDVKD